MGEKRSRYNTGQRQAISEYLRQSNGQHITVANLVQHLAQKGVKIGLTTAYRHLEALVEGGSVKKYQLEDNTAACFQYCPEPESPMHFHLKCQGCGQLIHLECDFMDGLKQHVLDEHGFCINESRTVLYGNCADCSGK